MMMKMMLSAGGFVVVEQLLMIVLLLLVLLLLDVTTTNVTVTVVNAQTFVPCNICPNNGAVTNFFAPLGTTGQNCGEVQLDAQAGLLDSTTCTLYQSQSIYTTLCGCTSGTTPTFAPTTAPTTPNPTNSPTNSPTQPFCNICGNDGFVGCNGVVGNSVCQEVRFICSKMFT